MPPKITNPTPKDLDDAIQATNQRLDELIQSNQQSMNALIGQMHTRMDNQYRLMDSRFNTLTTMLRLDELIQSNQQSMNAQIGQMHTRMDNQDQLMDSRFNALTTMLQEKFASLTIPHPQTLPVVTTAPASPSHISGLDTNFTAASPSITVSLSETQTHGPVVTTAPASPSHISGLDTNFTAASPSMTVSLSETQTHGGCWRRMLINMFSLWLYVDKEKWLDSMKVTMSLVATVIANITYQATINPPGGVYSTEKITESCTPVCAGQAVMSVVDPGTYSKFLNTNGICFLASLIVIFLLVSGINIEHRFFMWLMSFGMLTVLFTFGYSYILSVLMLTPNIYTDHHFQDSFRLMRYLVLGWICGLVFITVCHLSSIIFWIVKYIQKQRKEKESSAPQ